MHYVTCIGNRYMLLKLISNTHYITYGYMIACNVHIGVMLYQPIWLCALCDLYWETGTCCKLISTHIISLMIIWLHVMYISEHILYQPIWLCALCSLYWEQVHAAKLISTHIISFVIIWLHVMYISQHIYLYPSVWLCALCNLYWGTGTCCKLIPNTCYITFDYMIACNVHIATYIISARLAVCIM
jgi:hypothetical protein